VNWLTLSDSDALESVIALSHDRPQLLFKHSTRCGTSAMAKGRLERDSQLLGTLDVYLIDVLRERPLSNHIAQRLGEIHESPQLLVLHKGEVVLVQSHFDVNAPEVMEVLGVNT
jgi:bacillithiol system protein YtxJ